MRKPESTIPVTMGDLDERACAYQNCMVFMRQAYPNGAVMTYDRTAHQGAHQVLLCKYVIGVGEYDAPFWIGYEDCLDETTANNIPGALESRTYLTDGTELKVTLYPLFLAETIWNGKAVLSCISTAI